MVEMKRLTEISSIICIALLTTVVLVGCISRKSQQTEATQENNDVREAVTKDSSDMNVFFVKVPAIELPAMMMPGPIDPIVVDEPPLLLIANLAPYQTIEELHASPFYAQLCSVFPQLEGVNEMIDTGKGELWFIRPWNRNTSLSINEYNMAMFNGEQGEGSGKIYLRTEDLEPMLLRMSVEAPGTVQMQAVDNEGRHLSWIPTQEPQSKSLRIPQGVVSTTFNPVDNSVDFGADYCAKTADGKLLSLRFYANSLLRLNDQLFTYQAFLLADGDVGLYIIGMEVECYAILDGMAPDQGFSMIVKKGTDLGFGLENKQWFQNEEADDE